MARQEEARVTGTATRRFPTSPSATIGWAEAEKIVLRAYGDFAPEMATIAKQFFDKNWIDASVKPGKAPGAFSASTVPSVHPYVMMNYLGKPRDVMTLAHELGHGVHQMAGASARSASGADAVDARRNRLRLRRDADVQGAARRDARTSASARP